METKFYVGMTVRSDQYGIGKVLKTDSDRYFGRPVYVCFDNAAMSYTIDGRKTIYDYIDLHPIDPPKTTLTEWQRKKLEHHHYSPFQIELIESILSEPEPPKYEPKQWEAVLFPEDGILKVGVFSNMVGDKYRIEDGSRSAVHKICIPYEANKQGYSADALLSELSKPTHQ